MFSSDEPAASHFRVRQNADPSHLEPAMNLEGTHHVSLLRRPSPGGRAALICVVLLAIGPGGTLLFRFTHSLFANDASERAEDAMVLSATTAGQKNPNSSEAPHTDASQAVGWQSAPHWDLTEKAKDAWMVVERPFINGSGQSTSTVDLLPPAPAEDDPAPVTSPRADSDIQLVNDEKVQPAADAKSLPAIRPNGSSTSAIPSPPRPSETVIAPHPAPQVTETAVAPHPHDVQDTRENWQDPDGDFFAQADEPPMNEAPAQEELPAAQPEPAPVAPPADSPSAPSEEEPLPTDVAPEAAQSLVTHPPDDVFAFPEQGCNGTSPMYPGQMCGTCPRPMCGVHCNGETCCKDLHWNDSWLIPWEVFAQGEYLGPARTPHVPEYRLRVDDQVEFVYRLTGERTAAPYRINTGDTLRIESLTSETLNREALVQPDGTISLAQLGQVLVAGRTIDEVRAALEEQYSEHVRNPGITVTPLKLNTVLEELRATVDSRLGNGGQSRFASVTPEGTIQLPAIGSVPAHGLTLDELAAEINYRYESIVHGLEVTPILADRAPHYVYVVGEVRTPGRFSMEGPTTLMQAIAMAGGWNVGANLTQVVVFRRDECWRLMATKVGIRRGLYGKDPCPDGEIWLRDSDIVVIPKSPILVADEFIDLVFTRGVYGVIPFSTNLSYVRDLSGAASAVVPVP